MEKTDTVKELQKKKKHLKIFTNNHIDYSKRNRRIRLDNA